MDRTVMDDDKKYCPVCDENSMALKNSFGRWFYGCDNYASKRCVYTFNAGEEEKERQRYQEKAAAPVVIEYSRESLVAQAQTRDAIPRGIAGLSDGPAAVLVKLQANIPGFGKSADDLTDEDRHARADYIFSALLKGGFNISQPLPYDPKKRGGAHD